MFCFVFFYRRCSCVDRKDCDAESKGKLMMELQDLIRGKAKQVRPAPAVSPRRGRVSEPALATSPRCPASRWRLPTTLCGCCSASSSLAPTSRGSWSSRSSKVSRPPPPPFSGSFGSFQESRSCSPRRRPRQFVQVAVRQTRGEEAADVRVRALSLSGTLTSSRCFRFSPWRETATVTHVAHSVRSDKELVAAVMRSFRGHVRPMLRHAAASSVIEYAYNDKAVLAQRLMLAEELYGNTFAVCKVWRRRRDEHPPRRSRP